MPSAISDLTSFALVVVATSIVGCVSRIEPQGYGDFGETGGAAGSEGALAGSGGQANGAQAGTGGSSSEPLADGYCRVQSLLSDRCGSCHTNSLQESVPVSLVTYDDLIAPSPSDASLRVIDVSLARMRSETEPMPPKPAAPIAEKDLAFIEAWIQGGMPATCGSISEPKPGVYDTPTVCTSDSHWTRGDDESPKMHPGRACIACHSGSSGEDEEEDEGPKFWLAGTVYPTAHEPDECNGVDGGSSDARIEIVDADGQTLTLSVNSAGNFYYEREAGKLALPYVAKVLHEGRERVMATPQRDGDCNSCHTQDGDQGAPARILLP